LNHPHYDMEFLHLRGLVVLDSSVRPESPGAWPLLNKCSFVIFFHAPDDHDDDLALEILDI
jgi:hypothetical protein